HTPLHAHCPSPPNRNLHVYTCHHPFLSSLRFLHLSVLPRALHSFPTRRSSDLPCMASTCCCATTTSTRIAAPSSTTAQRCGSRSDRKSTRLNSSHQIISYAVFCLKKKNMIENNNGG